MDTATKSVLIYCRVSTKGQEEDGTSLDVQEAACVAKAQELGFTEWRIHREAHTGADLYDRPLLARDRNDIKAGKYQAVIVWRRDRLARPMAHRAILRSEFRHYGVQFIPATEKLGDTLEDQLLEYVD